jgi:hypothetical protein
VVPFEALGEVLQVTGQLLFGRAYQSGELVERQSLVDLEGVAEGIAHRAGAGTGRTFVHERFGWRKGTWWEYCTWVGRTAQ